MLWRFEAVLVDAQRANSRFQHSSPAPGGLSHRAECSRPLPPRLLIIGGVASIVFGVLVIIYPGTGALAAIWWIGAYALVIGVLSLALAFRVRKLVGPSIAD